MNTIHAPSIINSPASASWIPICLPKFNPAGFVNAYVSFLRKAVEEERREENGANPSEPNADTPTQETPRPDNGDDSSTAASEGIAVQSTQEPDSGIALVCISGGGEFETIRTWCDIVTKVCFIVSASHV